MALDDWVLDDKDFDTFKAGFDDQRARKTNYFWGPVGLQWYTRAAPEWSIKDLGLPKVPMPFGIEFANPALLYPEVRKTAALLRPIYGSSLYWNPRTGAWMKIATASAPPPGGQQLPPCVPRMTQELAGLDQLHREGTLQEQEWRAQRTRVIQSCLGSSPG